MPKSWDRHRFLNQLREAIKHHPKVNKCFQVAPGVFAIIVPFGIDLRESEPQNRLQVWLAIRSCGTDQARITTL